MPIYEYRCADCQHVFEVLRSYNSQGDNTAAACTQCQSTQTHRLVSRFTPQRGGDGEFGDGSHWSQQECGTDHCGCGDVHA